MNRSTEVAAQQTSKTAAASGEVTINYNPSTHRTMITGPTVDAIAEWLDVLRNRQGEMQQVVNPAAPAPEKSGRKPMPQAQRRKLSKMMKERHALAQAAAQGKAKSRTKGAKS